MDSRRFLSGILYSLSIVAVIQVITAIFSLAFITSPAGSSPGLIRLIFLVTFTLSGLLLYRWSDSEFRIKALGTSFFIAASSFALPYNHSLLQSLDSASMLLDLALTNPVEPFLAMTTWLLVGNFPRTIKPISTLKIVIPFTLVISSAIYLINVFAILFPGLLPEALVAAIGNTQGPNIADVLVYGLSLISLPYCWWLNRFALEQERNRVNIFMAGLFLGLGLPCVFILLTVIPVVNDWSYTPFAEGIVIPTFQLLILTVPFTTGYALIVDEVLSPGKLVRNSLRYLFAKWTIIFFSTLPLLLLGIYFYNLRNQTLVQIIANPVVLLLLVTSVAGFSALGYRKQLIEILDKRFYRQTISPEQILNETIAQIPQATNIQEQCLQTISRIDKALHPENIFLFLLNTATMRYTNFENSRQYLLPDSPMIREISSSRQAVGTGDIENLELNGNISFTRDQIEIVIPLLLLSAHTIGFFLLGPKRSGIPYTLSEKALLSTIGVSTALALETQDFRSSRQHQPIGRALDWTGIGANDQSHLLRVCPICNIVLAPDTSSCCGHETETGTLPTIVNGRFQIKKRLGKGTMGEVYEATDIGLERKVALKTLTSASADAQLLQLESKASASMRHENLAAIFDIQWSFGTPVLIFELLENGTLNDRLQAGPLLEREVIELGIGIATALEYMHRNGIWHQDIKPGNIGFDRENTPKLLDFGLASRKHPQSATLTESSFLDLEVTRETLKSTYSNQGLVGTPLYWSPEILRGQPRTAAVDIWALCLVLYEALTGRNPMERGSWPESFQCITKGSVARVEEFVPTCSKALSAMLMQGLSGEIGARIVDASVLKQRLLEITQPH